MAGGEHDIVQKAEAHRALSEGMVTGRPRNRERSAMLEPLLHRRQRHAGGRHHTLPAARAHERVPIERASTARRQGLEHVDVVRGMDALDRRACGGR